MWPRRLLVVALGLFAGVFDAAVASWFPGPFAAMRVALPLVTVLAAFSSQERALTAAVAAGLAEDVLMPSFGFVTFRFVAIALLIHALAQRFFSNRSLPGSLALGVVGLGIDRLLLLGFIALTHAWTGEMMIFEVRAGWVAEVMWVMCVMTAAFLGVAALTRRFLPPVTRR